MLRGMLSRLDLGKAMVKGQQGDREKREMTGSCLYQGPVHSAVKAGTFSSEGKTDERLNMFNPRVQPE